MRDLPGVKFGKPAYTWPAPFRLTDDLLTIMGRVPGFDRAFALTGFGGNGITFSMIGAQIITAPNAGKPDPDADIFRFR